MDEVTQSINRIIGIVMVLQEERRKLCRRTRLPSCLHGLLAEFRAREDRWLQILDNAKIEPSVPVMEILDDVPIHQRR